VAQRTDFSFVIHTHSLKGSGEVSTPPKPSLLFTHQETEMDDGGIGIVEILFRCNILALVGGGANPKFARNKGKTHSPSLSHFTHFSLVPVMIWDDFQVRCIAELEFRSNVKGVKLRRDRIVIVLDTKVYVYNFSDLTALDQINTYPNPQGNFLLFLLFLCFLFFFFFFYVLLGLVALSSISSNLVLVTLGEKVGEVLVNLYDSETQHVIPAHTNPISQIALNISGTMLATTSDRGTLIRVFDTKTGKKMKELRRGAQQAKIQSLAFSSDSSCLCVASDKGTVHIYSLGLEELGSKNRQSSMSFMKNFFSYYASEWSFAQFEVPETQCLCCFGPGDDSIIGKDT